MMKITQILMILFFGQITNAFAQSPILPNGTYFVNSSLVNFPDYRMVLCDTVFTNYYADDTVCGKVAWEGDELILTYEIEEVEYSGVGKILNDSASDYSMKIIRLKENRYAYKLKQLTKLNVIFDEGIITPDVQETNK